MPLKCRTVPIAVLLLLVLTHAGSRNYAELVDAIEEQTQQAVRLHRAGQTAGAHAKLDDVRASFQAAVKIDKTKPDAYVAYATAMLNSNNLDEAIKAWKSAQKRVDRAKEPRLGAWVDGRLRWSRYGKVSMKRDKLYSHGQGNLIESLKLMSKQLEIYPDFPSMHHDMATARVMVSDYLGLESNATDLAVEGFAAAQQAAFVGWKAGLKERGRSGPECDEIGGIVYDWPERYSQATPERGALVSLEQVLGTDLDAYGPNAVFQDHGAYVARFENVGISGDDGIIVDEARCQIFMASAGLVVNLAYNLQMLETWGDPPTPYADGPAYKWYDHSWGQVPNHGAQDKPLRVQKAASVVQFAGKSFFHTLTELFGRFWVLKEHGVFADPEVRLILPQASGFLAAGLNMLMADLQIGSDRIIHWARGHTDVRLYVDSLFYADWTPPAALSKDGGHCPTPRSVVLGARAALMPSLLQASKKKPRTVMIFIKRKSGDMRSNVKGALALQKNLEGVAKAATPTLKFEVFDGTLKPEPTVQLFAAARAVVGVHGGALTNILWCKEGAELFELGFKTPFAGHYRHLAAALGMKVTLLPLVPDNRGMGNHEVEIADVAEATEVVRTALAAEVRSEL